MTEAARLNYFDGRRVFPLRRRASASKYTLPPRPRPPALVDSPVRQERTASR